jgi:hypothetical protein
MSRHKAAVSRRRINHDRINRLQKEVEAVWNCVSSLRADLAPAGKEQLIQVRQLCRYFNPGAQLPPVPQITPAQVAMLLFADRLALALHEFLRIDN